MTTRINRLTGGAEGTPITNANSAVGGDAFDETDTPQTTVGGAINYGVSHGLPAIHTITGATSGPQRVGWQVNPTLLTSAQWSVFYVDPADIVGSSYAPWRAMNASSSGQRAVIQVTSTGTLTLRNNASTVIWTSAALTPGTRYRVEVMWEGHGTAVSSAQVKIFEDEGTAVVQDSGVLTNQSFGGPTQSIWWGQTNSASNNAGKISGRVGWSDEGWIGPEVAAAEPQLVTHLATGVPSHNSVTVSQKWNNADGRLFQLVVSQSSDLSSPSVSSEAALDSLKWVKLSVASLTPDALYYGGVRIDGVLHAEGRFSFKTAPTPGNASSHSIFFGSCRWNEGGNEAFAKMKEMVDAGSALHGRPVFLADMGDNGYPDWGLGGSSVTEAMVLDHLVSQSVADNIQDLMKALPWSYQLDNHDSGGEGSDKNGSWKTPVVSAYKRAVPHRTLPSASDALFYSIDWGRVRYIAVDNRTGRDADTDPDGPDKRMWTQEQEDWVVGQVASWPWAVAILGGIYCRQDSPTGTRWGGYSTQFNRLHDRLNATDSLRRVVWLAGDRHALAADLGVSPTTRGVPQAVGAPFEQGSVDLPNNEQWNVGGGTAYYNPTPNQNMRAFGEASFTDDGSDTIVFTFTGRTADGVTRVQMTHEIDVSPRVLWRSVVPWVKSSSNSTETAIWAENLLAGASKTDWDVDPAFPGGNPTIHGFATAMSVDQGGTLSLKVHSPNADWTGEVYRVGWYGGSGARKVATISGPQTTQPNGTVDPTTGMASCQNWAVNGTWNVPANACRGTYFIKVYRNDNGNLRSHIGPFVVRDPSRKALMAVKLSDSTWQAYNYAGADPNDPFNGKSIYGVGTPGGGFTFNDAQRAKAVSYDRPLVNRAGLPQATFWNGEYPLIRWVERLGYDVDYVSTLDVDADPTLLLDRQVVVSSGHDEYHSARVKSAFEEARDAGVHLVWLSANESFWRINPTSPGAREYACYKDSLDGALNPTGVFSGTWQDTRGFNSERRPAALLTGQRFRLNGISAYAMKASAVHASIPFWRNTSVASLTGVQEWESAAHLVGFEGNEPANAGGSQESPSGLLRLSEAVYSVTGMLSDNNGADYDNSGSYTHSLTLYRAASGAGVFATGTNQYAWALDDDHVRYPGTSQVSNELRQGLTNILADFGVLPVEVPSGLVMPVPVSLDSYDFPEDLPPVTEAFTFDVPPNLPDLSDGAAINTGIRFAVSVSGTWVGNRVHTTTTNPGTVTVSAYNDDTDTELGSGSSSSVLLGQEVDILFDTPVAVHPGINYMAGYHTNRYVASPISEETWPKTTGRIHTDPDGSSVAKYRYNATPAMPNADSPSNHFHVSPIIEF